MTTIEQTNAGGSGKLYVLAVSTHSEREGRT